MIETITGACTAVGSWFINTVSNTVDMFHTGTDFTMLGAVVVVGFGVAITMTVIATVTNFLRFGK